MEGSIGLVGGGIHHGLGLPEMAERPGSQLTMLDT
jgi:hypothetical protein